MKLSSTLRSLALGAAATLALGANASNVAMLIGYDSIQALEDANPQESTAAAWFTQTLGGDIITPAQLADIDASKYECIWIHIDRCDITKGWQNLPEAFRSDEALDALAAYIEDGGNLYLSKYATQLVAPLGRMAEEYAPGIVSENGQGGEGTDVWTINAHLGYWKGYLCDEAERDLSQVYDRRGHAIYKDLEVWPAHCGLGFSEFETESFPMEGTGDGTPMWREDHNCMWDLNAYNYTVDGKNTIEKFEKQTTSQVIGTWGHVVDFAVAGIVDFGPKGAIKGRIVANGLATCEWSPRTGVNKYDANLKKLTANTINYLTKEGVTAVKGIAAEQNDATAEYYTVSGLRVAQPTASGLYICRQGDKVSKILVK